jgi:hypothetical protein
VPEAATPDELSRTWRHFTGNAACGSAVLVQQRRAHRARRLRRTAGQDAIAACFYTRFHYWFVRPSQADPAITPAAGLNLPNHPSYPPAHSCESGAFQGVLSAAFPSESDALERQALEPGSTTHLSR